MLRRTVGTARAVLGAVRESQLSFLAAGIAYYALVSLFPLGLLALVVATVVGGEAFATTVVDRLGAVLTPATAELVTDTLFDARGQTGATLVSVGLLLWGGLRLFRGLDVAFSVVYGVDGTESFVEQLKDALIAFLGFAAAIGVVVVVSGLLARSGVAGVGLLGPAGLVVALTVVFLPLYLVFPDVPVTVREALPGTALAAAGWTLLGTAFSAYAQVAGSFAVYGIVGGILLLVTWFYFASLAVLSGAVLNAVLAGVLEDRQLQQAAGPRVGAMTDEEASDDDPDAGADLDGAGPGVTRGRGGDGDDPDGDGSDDEGSDDGGTDAGTAVRELRAELESFREDVDERTLHRDEVEDDLRRYVRARVRRGKARGWGPYLVLLYGTVMTVGAFRFLSGGWAILAMLVVWLSTLGLYALMLLVGFGVNLLGLPGRLADRFRD